MLTRALLFALQQGHCSKHTHTHTSENNAPNTNWEADFPHAHPAAHTVASAPESERIVSLVHWSTSRLSALCAFTPPPARICQTQNSGSVWHLVKYLVPRWSCDCDTFVACTKYSSYDLNWPQIWNPSCFAFFTKKVNYSKVGHAFYLFKQTFLREMYLICCYSAFNILMIDGLITMLKNLLIPFTSRCFNECC